MKENIIEKKSFEFALEVIKLYQLLIKEKEFTISKQFEERYIHRSECTGINFSTVQKGLY